MIFNIYIYLYVFENCFLVYVNVMYFQREKRKVNKPRNISHSLGTDPLSCLGKYKETNEKVNIVILNLAVSLYCSSRAILLGDPRPLCS